MALPRSSWITARDAATEVDQLWLHHKVKQKLIIGVAREGNPCARQIVARAKLDVSTTGIMVGWGDPPDITIWRPHHHRPNTVGEGETAVALVLRSRLNASGAVEWVVRSKDWADPRPGLQQQASSSSK